MSLDGDFDRHCQSKVGNLSIPWSKILVPEWGSLNELENRRN